MISNEEFASSMQDNNNIALAKSILKRFKLTPDDRKEVYLIALWKALKQHKIKPDYKFSTLLCNYVRFECLRLFKERQTFIPLSLIDRIIMPDINQDEIFEIAGDFQDILRMRYIDKMNLREIANQLGLSHETARKYIKKGLQKMREFYETD